MLDNSFDGKYYVVVFYEVSGMVGVFEIVMFFMVIFVESIVEVMEGIGSIELFIEIEQAGGLFGNFMVNVVMVFIVVVGEDYNLGIIMFSILVGLIDVFSFDLEVFDNSSMSGKYFILEFDESSIVLIGSGFCFIVLIVDNDDVVLVVQVDLSICFSYVGSFVFGVVVEIVVYDFVLQWFFFINFEENQLDIVDFFNLASFFFVFFVDMVFYGGGINFVVVYNGFVVVVMEVNIKIDNGIVVFFDMDGVFLNQVNVGLLFDMFIFIFDGIKILIVNEGELNDDYDVDFEGFVSIIDVSGGVVLVMVVILLLIGFNDDEAIFVV